MKNCASLKEYSTFQKNDTFARNIENINMNMVSVSLFYIYDGLEPTEDETNTITWFRGRFRPISKFEIFWQKFFPPEIWIFWWNSKFCPEVLEMFHMVQKTSKGPKVLIFQHKNYDDLKIRTSTQELILKIIKIVIFAYFWCWRKVLLGWVLVRTHTWKFFHWILQKQ